MQRLHCVPAERPQDRGRVDHCSELAVKVAQRCRMNLLRRSVAPVQRDPVESRRRVGD